MARTSKTTKSTPKSVEIRELANTIEVDGYTYNITACHSVNSDNAIQADQVKNKLTIALNSIPATEVEFNGSEAQTISVVPSTGGVFSGEIAVNGDIKANGHTIEAKYISANENITVPIKETFNNNDVINYHDIKNVVLGDLVNRSVVSTWDGESLTIGVPGVGANKVPCLVIVTGEDDAVRFASYNYYQTDSTKQLPAFIYVADNGNIYFGTSASPNPSAVQVSANTANTANQLAIKRNFSVDLREDADKPSNSDIGQFNGTDDVVLGVSGILPVAHGGTGANYAEAAEYNINSAIKAFTNQDVDTTDKSLLVFRTIDLEAADRALYAKKLSDVLDSQVIKDSITNNVRTTFGFTTNNVLPISKGGTGATSKRAAEYNILEEVYEADGDATKDSFVAFRNANANPTDGVLHYRRMSHLWPYIAGKIREIFGFTKDNVLTVENGGTGTDNLSKVTVGKAAEATKAARATNADKLNVKRYHKPASGPWTAVIDSFNTIYIGNTTAKELEDHLEASLPNGSIYIKRSS